MKIHRQKRLLVIAATLAAGMVCSASVWAFNFGGGGGGGGSDPASEYANRGPQATITESAGASCTVYRPSTLTSNHPVILWGNGTGSRPSSYRSGLSHWASYGFVVVAANTSNAGTGAAMLNCLDAISQSNISAYLNLSKVGTSGHSQGGGGAIMAGQDSRVDTAAPMQPYTVGLGHQSSSQSNQNGPMLLMSGGADSIASERLNQAPVFRRANEPVFWASRDGATHFDVSGDFGNYAGISTAWFLYQLSGDQDAGELFYGACEMCSASGWTMQLKGF